MVSIDFAKTDALLEASSSSQVSWVTVESDELEQFSHSVAAVRQVAWADREEWAWEQALSILKRQRRELSVAPLPFNHQFFGCEQAVVDLLPIAARVRRQFSPYAAAALDEAINDLATISVSIKSPLLDAVLEQVTSVGSGLRIVILPKDRYVQPLRDLLKHRPAGAGVKAMTPRDFMDSIPASMIVVCGSSYWYRDCPYVLQMPHSRVARIMRWPWVGDSIPEITLLNGSKSATSASGPRLQERRERLIVDAEELVPEIDWASIGQSLAVGGDEETDIYVSARSVLLQGGLVTAVAASGERREYVLSPEEVGADRVQEIASQDLRVGDFILLRTQGGDDDYIRAMADEYLGATRAERLRSLQTEWKDGLSVAARRLGLTGLITALKNNGSTVANHMNVRNWLSSMSLRTRDRADFAAILVVAGLTGREDEFWSAMGELHSAHIHAGHRIGELLREAVASADLSSLQEDGRADIALQDNRAGSLSALRVEAISPDRVRVPQHALGRVVKGDDSWQE
jgi:hypothetical protein